MSARDAQQVRTLALCGERSPVIGELLGLSPRTIKRIYRRTHVMVATGRPPGVPRSWFGRNREPLRRLLHMWVTDGLACLLSGDAPHFLIRLAADCGLGSPAQVSALLGNVQLGVDVEPRQCAVCGSCYLAFVARGRQPFRELCCPNPRCRRQWSRDAARHPGDAHAIVTHVGRRRA